MFEEKNEFGVYGQMLHSKTLEFAHPTTGELMHLEAKLPAYFQNIIDYLDTECSI